MRTSARLLVALLIVSLITPALAQQGGRGRNKRIFVVPAPSKVVFNGKLDEWDLSGQINIYVTQETSEMQSAKVALMYDAEAIYISADVRDPTPMMNRHDPRVNAERAWDADAFQIRFQLDPEMGYPINFGSMPPQPHDQIVHLLMWHYTDDASDNLQLRYGMDYALPPGKDLPFGMVPKDGYQGKFIKNSDGRGFVFEYRIPWSTVQPKRPIKAGDLVASAIQIQWGSPSGLDSSGGGWAMDLMSGPGFSFQSTACWGKAIFSDKGNLPKEITQEGLPIEPPLPLTIEYNPPGDGDVTIALQDSQGQFVRYVVVQQSRKAGKVIDKWDGLHDAGKPLLPGKYTWKGIYHEPIITKYVMGLHNSGSPSYRTPEGTGAWGADHGRPSTVSAAGDHMLLAWDGGEAGDSILKTDLAGRKIWGIKPGALHLAVDLKSDRVFIVGGGGFHDGAHVQVYSLIDGRPLRFGTGPDAEHRAGG